MWYFWDSIELVWRRLAPSLGTQSVERVKQSSELLCTMNDTTQIACLKTLRRIPCACHAFNILQAIMKFLRTCGKRYGSWLE